MQIIIGEHARGGVGRWFPLHRICILKIYGCRFILLDTYRPRGRPLHNNEILLVKLTFVETRALRICTYAILFCNIIPGGTKDSMQSDVYNAYWDLVVRIRIVGGDMQIRHSL